MAGLPFVDEVIELWTGEHSLALSRVASSSRGRWPRRSLPRRSTGSAFFPFDGRECGAAVPRAQRRTARSRLRRGSQHRLRAPVRRRQAGAAAGPCCRAGTPASGRDRHRRQSNCCRRQACDGDDSHRHEGRGDPVGAGFIASLARPGGNITGVTVDANPEIYAKNLGLLTDIVPGLSRVGVLRQVGSGSGFAELAAAARKLN